MACVILAAGMSYRFHATKQLAKLPDSGKTLIQNAVDIANGSKCDYLIVVLGHGASRIMKKLNPGRAQIILNREYELGLSSSIRASISNLPGDCSAAVLMVADQPFLNSRLINKLVETLQVPDGGRKDLASLAFQNEPRNPVIFSRKLFPSLLSLGGDRGAKDIVKANLKHARLINVSDPLVFLDIDTHASLRKISQKLAGAREKEERDRRKRGK